MKGPIVDYSTLPVIDNDKLFYKSDLDNEFLRFSITNTEYEADEIMNIEVPDQEFNDKFTQLENFDKASDFVLLRSIDKRVKEVSESMELKSLKETQFA